MISRRLYVLLLLLLSLPIMAQTLASLENAKTAYENDEYDNAIQFLELTIDGGIYNGEIFYNLGTAYYQQGDIAKALLNYRRALQSLPRDLDLNTQIARTRSLRTLPQTETTHPLIVIEQLTENVVTINELSIITLIIWIVFWSLTGFYVLRDRWRNPLRLVIGIMFMLTVLFVAMLGTRLYIHNSMQPAIITVNTAPIYSGPSVSYFRQYDLFAASEIYVVEEQDGWVKFIMANGQQGWIASDAITRIPIN